AEAVRIQQRYADVVARSCGDPVELEGGMLSRSRSVHQLARQADRQMVGHARSAAGTDAFRPRGR
nr:hypothetical protein [Tanacetum cinerariifolium]